MSFPSTSEYAPFYHTYVCLVKDDDLHSALHSSLKEITENLNMISVENADHAYAEGKWTLKELLQHMIDTERVFSFRAMAFARGEQQNLPGFDENAYARTANATARSIDEMKEELLLLRKAVYLMFKGFGDQDLLRSGTANNNSVTVNALGYIIIGHVRHHFNVIRERYL